MGWQQGGGIAGVVSEVVSLVPEEGGGAFQPAKRRYGT